MLMQHIEQVWESLVQFKEERLTFGDSLSILINTYWYRERQNNYRFFYCDAAGKVIRKLVPSPCECSSVPLICLTSTLTSWRPSDEVL